MAARHESRSPHSTVTAMRRHERDGEPLCDECQGCPRRADAENYARREAAAEAAAAEEVRKREARNARRRAKRAERKASG